MTMTWDCSAATMLLNCSTSSSAPTAIVTFATEAIKAIKRAVNVGGSLSMAEGLHLERAEFLASLPQRQAQEIMLRYLRDTAETGELPLYQPGGYAAALAHGNTAVDTTTKV